MEDIKQISHERHEFFHTNFQKEVRVQGPTMKMSNNMNGMEQREKSKG